MLAIAIAALVLLLPHKSATSASSNLGPANQSTANQSTANPSRSTTTAASASTSVKISTSTRPNPYQNQSITVSTGNHGSNNTKSTTSTTTTTAPQGLNIKSIEQAALGSTTSTIYYVYCAGSLTPPYNQSYYAGLYPSGVSSWSNTTNYTIPFTEGSCVTSNDTIYCIGDQSVLFSGYAKNSYYANISSSGIGGWNATTSYPVPFEGGSCSAYNNYIYCVGTMAQGHSNESYYAPLSPHGIGSWTKTTPFPVPFYGAQCNTYNNYIYCFGDSYSGIGAAIKTSTPHSLSALLNETTYNYYAPITTNGIGAWQKAPAPSIPETGASCIISGATIYCITAAGTASLNLHATSQIPTNESQVALLGQSLSATYSAVLYSTIMPNGTIGMWHTTAPYPESLEAAGCVSAYGSLYCIGSASNDSAQSVLYSIPAANGISQWVSTSDYPIPFEYNYCATGAVSS